MEHTLLAKLIEQSPGLTISVSLRELKEWHNWILHTTRVEAESKTISADEQLLSPIHTRKMLDVSTMQLHRWKKANYLIPIRIGNTDKYKLSDIKQIIEQGYERNEDANKSKRK